GAADAHVPSASSAVGVVRVFILLPAVKMPNVGEVVDQPPADVVTCRGVLAARIPETDYDLQGLSNNYYLLDSSSPSPSSSDGPLPMTSGSAAASGAPSTPSAAGVSSITARGAATTATEVSGSSRISTPSGSLMSLTWRESPITIALTSSSTWSGMLDGSTSISSSRRVWSSTPPSSFTPSGMPRRV